MAETVPNEIEQEAERQVFQLNEKKFYSDSITENGNKLINSINIVNGEVEKIKLQLDIASIAKDALIGQLEGLTHQFEEVQEAVAAAKAADEATETQL